MPSLAALSILQLSTLCIFGSQQNGMYAFCGNLIHPLLRATADAATAAAAAGIMAPAGILHYL
jgi:hypothetical protein